MKCPKCGSKNINVEKSINGFSTCQDCGYKWQQGMKQPEPSTAEKLEYIIKFIESKNMYIQFGCGAIEIKKPLKGMEILCEATEIKYGNCEVFTFNEAIKQAYDWAKQEEQNAKN